MLNMDIKFLGKTLALHLFVYNSAHRMPGDTADPSSFTMATPVGQSFLNVPFP